MVKNPRMSRSRITTVVSLVLALGFIQRIRARDICTYVTTGGNANGAYCYFPFIYNSAVYDDCTMQNNDIPWCATVPNYDEDSTWGNCVVETSGGNAGGAQCVFPFIYRGDRYETCTTERNHNRDWCATVSNYDKDPVWGNCDCHTISVTDPPPEVVPCTAQTYEGNADGANCVFPFIYQGDRYNRCTAKNHDRLWCATVPDYDIDKTWGDCVCEPDAEEYCSSVTFGGNSDGAACVFPFIYQGNAYDYCIDIRHDDQWCATVPNYDDNKKWGNCIRNCPSTTPAPCVTYTVGGNAGGAPCVFPFIYNQLGHTKCTTENHDQPWCSTTSHYNQDRRWGNCGECVPVPTTPPSG